mgnify:FL=1
MKSLLTGLLLATLAWLPAAARAADPVEGQDYVRIEGQPWAGKAQRIEVAEVFGYPCPNCARLEPVLRRWKAGLPQDVDMVTVPAAFGGYWDDWARAYFAAAELGVAARTHPAVFDALHVQGSVPRNPTDDELAAFYAGHGVDPARFRAALASPAVEAQRRRAAAFVRNARLPGTPALVVAGRYVVQPAAPEDMLRTAGWLIARERASSSPTSR